MCFCVLVFFIFGLDFVVVVVAFVEGRVWFICFVLFFSLHSRHKTQELMGLSKKELHCKKNWGYMVKNQNLLFDLGSIMAKTHSEPPLKCW